MVDSLRFEIRTNINKSLLAEGKALNEGIPRVIGRMARELKGAWRRSARSAGLGIGISKSVREKFFRNQGHNAAAIVFASGKLSNRIFDLAHTGGIVRPRNSKFLQIPLKGAGRRSPVDRARRPRVEDFANDPRTRFIRLGRDRILVVRQTKRRQVPLFLLVRSTRHKRRMDLAATTRLTLEKLPQLILEEFPNQ